MLFTAWLPLSHWGRVSLLLPRSFISFQTVCYIINPRLFPDHPTQLYWLSLQRLSKLREPHLQQHQTERNTVPFAPTSRTALFLPASSMDKLPDGSRFRSFYTLGPHHLSSACILIHADLKILPVLSEFPSRQRFYSFYLLGWCKCKILCIDSFSPNSFCPGTCPTVCP